MEFERITEQDRATGEANAWNTFGPQGWAKTADQTANPDNDNRRLTQSWMTPAELLQWIRQEKEEMRRELAADFQLRSDPEHRLIWENLEAMERCTLQRHFGEQ